MAEEEHQEQTEKFVLSSDREEDYRSFCDQLVDLSHIMLQGYMNYHGKVPPPPIWAEMLKEVSRIREQRSAVFLPLAQEAHATLVADQLAEFATEVAEEVLGDDDGDEDEDGIRLSRVLGPEPFKG